MGASAFKYQPKGSQAPAQNVGLGLVEPGETYVTEDESLIAALKADPDFKAAKAPKTEDDDTPSITPPGTEQVAEATGAIVAAENGNDTQPTAPATPAAPAKS